MNNLKIIVALFIHFCNIYLQIMMARNEVTRLLEEYLLEIEHSPRNDNYPDYFRRRLITLLLEKSCGRHSIVGYENIENAVDVLSWTETFGLMVIYETTDHQVNCRNDTCVHLAFHQGAHGVAKTLLGRYGNIQVNPGNNDGLTFLHMACALDVTHLAEQIINTFPDDMNCQVRQNI